jgi:hypothetical protein
VINAYPFATPVESGSPLGYSSDEKKEVEDGLPLGDSSGEKKAVEDPERDTEVPTAGKASPGKENTKRSKGRKGPMTQSSETAKCKQDRNDEGPATKCQRAGMNGVSQQSTYFH